MTADVRATRLPAELHADPARVVAQLFLPGEELPQLRSRASQIVARVLELGEDEVDELAAGLTADFGGRHAGYEDTLQRHAAIVAAHVPEGFELSAARTLLLGATFTTEYAVEGAALCNPSAVWHPDQSDLPAGAARVAISLRGVGEGHRSTIGFCTAVVGPGASWTFDRRPLPARVGLVSAGRWRRRHFRTVLSDYGPHDVATRAVLDALPTQFGTQELEQALAGLPRNLLMRPGTALTIEQLRTLAGSAYSVVFDADSRLDQRVLMPVVVEESGGVEDARFTRVVTDNETVEYRATYTAYDGHRIMPRIITSPDLRQFRSHRISGAAARNKGMALFPRTVKGQHLALCRTDGESTMLATSEDGYSWGQPRILQRPRAAWEMLQVGNCGPPIETEQGWLVLTHGVGPMRRYSIGAILLDLDDPTRVLGHLEQPLITPGNDERDGYVPNVVYSCGGMVHDGLLWIPLGIDDARIGVAYAPLDDVLAALLRSSSNS